MRLVLFFLLFPFIGICQKTIVMHGDTMYIKNHGTGDSSGIIGGGVKNLVASNVKDRSNHIGTQPASSISDFTNAGSALIYKQLN